MNEWENVVADGTTQRLLVPGGWLYAVKHARYSSDTPSLVFVPFPPPMTTSAAFAPQFPYQNY